jgi:hypothetical protein
MQEDVEIRHGEWPLSFAVEPFTLLLAISQHKHQNLQNCDFTCWVFLWVWNSVSGVNGNITEGVREYGLEEDIWCPEGGSSQGWRKLNSEELHDLHSTPSIVWVIETRGIGWAWNVACMGKEINIYKVLVGGPEVKRALGRPRHMWDNWRALCELVNIPSVSINWGEFFLF